MRRAALVPVALLTFPSVARAQNWVDDTAGTIGTTAEWSNKVELADLDGDGKVDILFANGGNYYSAGTPEPQRVFRNTTVPPGTNPTFVEITDTVFGKNHLRLSRVIKVRDVDADGDQDIFVGGAHGTASELWLQQGNGAFGDFSASNLPQDLLTLGDAEFGDVDGDLDLDLVLADWGGNPTAVDGGQTRLWLNDGDGVFTDATSQLPVDLVGMSWDLEVLDVDDDRDLDILVSSKLDARGRLYLNDGAGTFTDDSAARLPAHTNNYEYEPMDIDADGDLDLVTINDGPGLGETVLVNDGDGNFTDETAARLGAADIGEDDNVIAFLDVDADEDADFLIGSLSGPDRLLLNDGTGVFTLDQTVMPSGTPGTLGLAVADLNGDGRLDVVQAQGEVDDPDKVQFADSSVAVDAAPPTLRIIHRATEEDLEVVVRIHDRKSPSLAHDWTAVELEIVSTTSTEFIPMSWRGEYLWVSTLPSGDPDISYRICATDAAGQMRCTPVLSLGEIELPDGGIETPDAGDPPVEGDGGGCCDAGGGAPGSVVLALLLGLGLVLPRRPRS
jgi:uncharacterized protein (TIGR03382 family)